MADTTAAGSSPALDVRDRLLALLEAGDSDPLTIADLRQHGINAPGQAVYELELAGHRVERVSWRDPTGHKTLGYRLHRSAGGTAGTHVGHTTE